MLAYASMLLCVTDRRRTHPFGKLDDGEASTLTREELVGTFIDVPTAETSALLAVTAELAGDDALLRARIRRELESRPTTGPPWLARLPEASTYRAVRMSHILNDGDNIVLAVRLPGGYELTCLVYIDHNLGTVVKDAFVIPEPIDAVVAAWRGASDEPDAKCDDIDLADARAWIEPAIALAAITFPPLETDTWPACRALVEWAISGLPDGGTGYQRPQWNSTALGQLADRFFASAYGARLDDDDHRGLLDSLLWYATDYGSGDPLRWSPVKIEILLDDWIPRKIVAPVHYLAKAPDLLRAFVGFAHAQSGLRADLTEEALTAIDELEPQYQQVILTPRPQGPAALLAALDIDAAGLEFNADEGLEPLMLDALALDVGGMARLDRLDDGPLPDEPFCWEGIPADVTARVQEVLALVDSCCEEILDVEYRTACRRLLARIASRGPEVFRRKGRAETAAAAVVWMVGKVNDLFGLYDGLQVKELLGQFGISQGSVSQRAATMLRAGGFDGDTYDLRLGAPEYLVAARRRRIIEMRNEYRARIDASCSDRS